MTRFVIAGLLVCVIGGASMQDQKISTSQKANGEEHLELGRFSVSLTVKDIGASRAFYEKLGFRAVGGNQAKN